VSEKPNWDFPKELKNTYATEKTWTWRLVCENCLFTPRIDIEKGKLLSDVDTTGIPCPNCGCPTIRPLNHGEGPIGKIG
jgi:hypothetical protein